MQEGRAGREGRGKARGRAGGRQRLPVAQSMLQANPDLNVIFCIADDGCLGAERAFLQTKPVEGAQGADVHRRLGRRGARDEEDRLGQRDPCDRRARPSSASAPRPSTRRSTPSRARATRGINFPYMLDLADRPRPAAKKLIAKSHKAVTDSGWPARRRQRCGAPSTSSRAAARASPPARGLPERRAAGRPDPAVRVLRARARATSRHLELQGHPAAGRDRRDGGGARARCSCCAGYVDLSVGSVAVLARGGVRHARQGRTTSRSVVAVVARSWPPARPGA